MSKEKGLLDSWKLSAPNHLELVKKYSEKLKYSFVYGGAIVGFGGMEEKSSVIELKNVLIQQSEDFFAYSEILLCQGVLIYPVKVG